MYVLTIRRNAQPGPLERSIFINSSGGYCFDIYPSVYLYMLTAERGWEWFDPIREDPRYLKCTERVRALVKTKQQ